MKTLEKLVLMTLLLFWVSCSSDSDDDGPINPPPNNDVTYSKNVKPIIDSKCLGCHSDPPANNAPMPLTTFDNVKDAVSNRGLIGLVESGSMPLNGTPLTTSQVQTIKDWQSGGFKE